MEQVCAWNQLRMDKFLLLLLVFLSIIQGSKSFVPARVGPPRWLSLLDASSSISLGKDYDLVIWDCDGVLVDSEALLKKGEVNALTKLGYSLTVDDCVRLFSGVSVDKAMENFEQEMGSKLPSNFFKEQIEGSLDLFRRELQPLMADTVTKLFDSKVPMCVASGSPRDRVLLSLEVGMYSLVIASSFGPTL